MFDLTGRVAVVTGGNGGIGLGMAHGLRDAGARIVVAGRNARKSASAVKELGNASIALEVDVADQDSCRAMISQAVDRCGGVDVLVNCAGINVRKQPQEFTAAEWNAVVATNLNGSFFCAQAVYPELQRRGGGKIINVASVVKFFGAPFVAPYGASKAALVQLTRTLAVAWAKDRIQVNAVLPGWVDTDLTLEARLQVPGIDERATRRTPAGRWGVPGDFAGVAVFLSSSESDFVTGASIVVDGGYSAEG